VWFCILYSCTQNDAIVEVFYLSAKKIVLVLVIVFIAILSTGFLLERIGFFGPPPGEGPIEEQPSGEPPFFTDPRLDRIANISLPIDIDDLSREPHDGAIGPWGYHGGNHPEGIDHTGFIFVNKSPIYAPDDGVVAEIEYRESDDIKVTIFHNHSLMSWFDHLSEVLVSENDFVYKGDIIGYCRYYEGMNRYLIDWGLVDFNNDSGPLFTRYEDSGKLGSFVPPFDYLNPGERKLVEDFFNETMLQPFLNGEFVPGMTKAEHSLINPVFPKRDSPDDIAGVWVYSDYWQSGGYPEILTFMHKNTKYFGEVFFAVYADFKPPVFFNSWDAEYEINTSVTPHRIKLTFISYGPEEREPLYGIYEIDTSGDRPILKIEFSNETYPSSFSENAATYFLRSRYHPIQEAKIPDNLFAHQRDNEMLEIHFDIQVPHYGMLPTINPVFLIGVQAFITNDDTSKMF